MGPRRLRNWLLRTAGMRSSHESGDGAVLMESPELRRLTGENPAELISEMRLANAIEAAVINERHASGEDGDYTPNIYVTCPALLGMFRFSREETERRIRKAFPDLNDKAVKASVLHLADRIAARITQKTLPDIEDRRSWVHGWRDQSNLFRL